MEKSALPQHFPEKRWQRVSGVTGPLIFIGILGLCGLSLAFFLPGIVIKSLLGGASIWTIVVTLPTVWSHRNDEIVLTADGIKGPRWKRSLRFADVEKIGLRRIFLPKTGNTFFEMNFIFKTRQKALTEWSLTGSCKSILLHVGTGMSEKPDIMLQTIYRYYRHEELPPAPKMRNEEFSEKDFPEKRWGNKENPLFWTVLLGLIALFLFFIIAVPDTGGRVACGVCVLFFGLVALFMWSTRNRELVLSADGVRTSKWKRALHFADVETIEILRSYTVTHTYVQLKFNFKTRQKSFSDWAPANSCTAVGLGLDPRLGETEIIAQTIYRYFTRQPTT